MTYWFFVTIIYSNSRFELLTTEEEEDGDMVEGENMLAKYLILCLT